MPTPAEPIVIRLQSWLQQLLGVGWHETLDSAQLPGPAVFEVIHRLMAGLGSRLGAPATRAMMAGVIDLSWDDVPALLQTSIKGLAATSVIPSSLGPIGRHEAMRAISGLLGEGTEILQEIIQDHLLFSPQPDQTVGSIPWSKLRLQLGKQGRGGQSSSRLHCVPSAGGSRANSNYTVKR